LLFSTPIPIKPTDGDITPKTSQNEVIITTITQGDIENDRDGFFGLLSIHHFTKSKIENESVLYEWISLHS